MEWDIKLLKKMLDIIKPGIITRITLVIILVAVISAAFSGIITLYVSKNEFTNYVNKGNLLTSQRYLPVIEDYYLNNGSLEGLQSVIAEREFFREGRPLRHGPLLHGFEPGRRVIVTDMDGTVVADSSNLILGQEIGDLDQDMVDFSLTVEGKQVGTFYIFDPLKKGVASLENEFINKISRQISNSIVIVASLALLLGILLARRITKPISALSTGIHEVAKGNLEMRLESRGDKEFASLARDFNHMAEQLYKHEQGRNLFISNIAHELRTPLSILRGQLEAVQGGTLEMSKEISSGLVDEVIRLTRLVKDLESIGLAEVGNLKLNIETVEIEKITNRLLPLSLAMEEEGVDFQVEIDPGLNQVKADINRLTQVLINLLTNALRHVGENGTVKLKIKRSEDERAVLFAVADDGPGIAEEDIKHIFERFYRVDESRSRQAGGVGLGLTIAKSYVEAHGGKIWVESQKGKGSTFYFSIPKQ